MRFPQVFSLLLFLAMLSAFVLPQRVTEAIAPKLGTLLTPVAQPSRAMARWATGRWGSSATPVEHRADAALREENEDLRAANARLGFELEALRQRNNEREELGDLRSRCTPVAVIGADSGTRDILTLRSFGGLADGMFVLSPRDVVGRIMASRAGAQVRLVTDPASHVVAYFGTFRQNAPGATASSPQKLTRLSLPNRVCDGAGEGRMVCRNLPFTDVEKAGLQVGDWAVIDDPDWQPLRGRRLGIVTAVNKLPKMMTEIELKPEADLQRLGEVMVLTR